MSNVLLAVWLFQLTGVIIAVPDPLTFDQQMGSAAHWLQFKTTFGRNYDNFVEERNRFDVFIDNKAYIDDHNRKFNEGKVSFQLGMNQFGDMTEGEFQARMLLQNNLTSEAASVTKLIHMCGEGEETSHIDWRELGAVTSVKNQENCSACWAFSTTGALESHYYINTGKLVELSNQNLLDCATTNFGCEGGNMEKSFIYIKKNGGIDTEESYPYEHQVGSCRFKRENIGAIIKDYVFVPEGDEHTMRDAVHRKGPVAVGIEVLRSFMFYKSGIYAEPLCTGATNHAVLVVGFGEEYGTNYWLVKNSWGEKWGEKGYIKIRRNFHNHCGIANYALYPLL